MAGSSADSQPTLEAMARKMARADRPYWAGNEEFWESYLPQARMWLAAYDVHRMNDSVHAVNAALEGGDVD